MTTRSRRLELVRRLIQGGHASTQETLVQGLAAHGESVTQATISRDLRDLGVFKGPEGYSLSAPSPSPAAPASADLARAVREFLLDAQVAGNLAVLKTGAGQASALALRLDRCGWPEIVGTVAGDDTIFVASATPVSAKRLVDLLTKIMNNENVTP